MSSPTFNSNNESKKPRIHLSPLVINHEKQVTNLRFHEYRPSKDDSQVLGRSLSTKNLNEYESFNENKLSEAQSCPKIAYDDRYIPRPIRDIPAACDAVNGFRVNAEEQVQNRINNLEEGVEDKYHLLRACISENDLTDDRILSFSKQAPKSHESGISKAIDFVRTSAVRPKWKLKRCVPKFPERVLDAPELINDYYLNVIDWGGSNHLSIGLGKSVYIWNANNGDIHKIDPQSEMDISDYVSSVHWSGHSSNSCLAVGYSSGVIKLYDVASNKCLRSLKNSTDRVPCLSWNENILTGGSRKGVIVNYDVRVQHALISCLSGHSQEVCGIAWSPDGRHLASGGNDNNVYVWEKTGIVSGSGYTHNFVSHRAAVKAVSWHPRESNVLATGGGTLDHTVNFWNVYTGTHLSSISANSQISGIVWNSTGTEFVTSHGFPQNQLTLWSYPTMEVSAHLLSHSNRVLSITLSPDGTTVGSIGADETLRLWKCFEPQPKKTATQRGPGFDLDDKPRSLIH